MASSEEIKSEIVLCFTKKALFRFSEEKINWEIRRVPFDTTDYSDNICMWFYFNAAERGTFLLTIFDTESRGDIQNRINALYIYTVWQTNTVKMDC